MVSVKLTRKHYGKGVSRTGPPSQPARCRDFRLLYRPALRGNRAGTAGIRQSPLVGKDVPVQPAQSFDSLGDFLICTGPTRKCRLVCHCQEFFFSVLKCAYHVSAEIRDSHEIISKLWSVPFPQYIIFSELEPQKKRLKRKIQVIQHSTHYIRYKKTHLDNRKSGWIL